jgi:hypothetical protein
MNTNKKRTVIFTTVMILTLMLTASAAAKSPDTVDICHKNGNGSYSLIEINPNALQAHLAHGDGTPGGAVAGQPGKVFGADCSIRSVEQNPSAPPANVPATNNNGKKADKVDICHRRGNDTFISININGNALPAHLGHGDGFPDGLVPNQPHMKFGDDCTIVEIPQKDLVQILTITSIVRTTVPSMVLKSGQLYEFKALGTYEYDPYSDWADAEWSFFDGQITKGENLPNFPPNILDLSINGCANNTDWGNDPSTHEYTMQWTGSDQQVSFTICDVYYPDNVGFLTVEIWRINW